MSSAAPMAIPPTGPAAAGGRPPPERANSLSAAAPSASSSSYRPVVAGGLSPAPSSIFSSASPMTPSPILASALSLPGGRSTGTFAFNPFFSTSPKTFAGAGPLASSPSAAASSGHQRSFSIAGGAGGGKPILVSGFPSGSAVADDDDEYDPSPPTSTRASLGGGGSGQPPFGLPPLRRPSQPVKLPAQLQSQVKPPSASGVSGPSVGAGSAGGVSKPPPTQVSLTAMKAPAGPTADVGNGGPQAGAGRGQGVLRRLSLGANSLLSRVRPVLRPQVARRSDCVADHCLSPYTLFWLSAQPRPKPASARRAHAHRRNRDGPPSGGGRPHQCRQGWPADGQEGQWRDDRHRYARCGAG